MEYRSLGRTGVQVSSLCLGCMNFGGRTPEDEAMAIIQQALDAGINFVDTANVYGHDPANFSVGRGRSEEMVGKALKTSGKRPQVVLATSCSRRWVARAEDNSERAIVVGGLRPHSSTH